MGYLFLLNIKMRSSPARSRKKFIHTRLLHDSSSSTMAKALSDLFAEETRLQSMAATHSYHSVLAASHRSGASRGTSEPCKHCKKHTHRSD